MTYLNKPRLKLLIVFGAMSLTTPALAQSVFTGFYGQVGIGYENSTPSYSGGTLNNSTYSYGISGGTTNSFAGTATIGYYFPVTGNFLLGIGAEYSPLSGVKSNATVTLPALKYSETQSIKKGDSYNLFISPAYAIDKEKLAYAKVGYSNANYEIGGDNDTYNGYSLGLGYRQIIQGSWYGFAEVNYMSYGNQNVATNASGTASFKVTNALVGVGYKF
ncbi:MAG: outer membrane beta-barrel protein [Burkholderiales bacterium]|nr:outer membrane beta-barrel protein [Burkholderiales bacterium]